METSSIKAAVLTIIFSILFVFGGFSCYYFFRQPWIPILVTTVPAFLLSHMNIRFHRSYDLCFLQALCSVVLSALLLGFLYWFPENNFFKYETPMLFFLGFHWFVPFLYSIIRNFYDRNNRIGGFSRFFIKASILFLIIYVLLFLWKFIWKPFFLPDSFHAEGALQFCPFYTTAYYIEQAIYQKTSILPYLAYISKIVLFFIPLGFYLWLFCNRLPSLVRLILLFIVPFGLEGLQCLLHISPCNMDDAIYSFFGCFAGAILSSLLNRLYLWKKDCSFLEEPESRFSYF